MLEEKLDSSQQPYKTLLEQYETFVDLNVKLSTKMFVYTIINEQRMFYLA